MRAKEEIMAIQPMTAKRSLGSSGIQISPLGLGCMSFSGVYGASDDGAAIGVIREAIDRGVTMLDTADMYGWGHNETLVGKAIARPRADIVLASKFGQVQRPGGLNGVYGAPGSRATARQTS